MEISEQTLIAGIAVAMGLVRIIEVLVVKGFSLVTGKKSNMDNITETLNKATNNHLHTIEETLKESGRITHDDHTKQIELMTKLVTIAEERRPR